MLDGGLATELERRGADLRDALWSARLLIDDPARIVEAHAAYVEAGADIITTASYQASVAGLMARGLDSGEAAGVLGSSVALAMGAAEHGSGPRPLVAASVGPYGAALADGSEYRGDYGVSRQRLREFHGLRLDLLLQVRPDLLAIETIPSPEEAEVILELLDGRCPAWVSYSCRDATHVSEGQDVTEAIRRLSGAPGLTALGFNCIPPSWVEALVGEASAVTDLPIVVYPNRGETWDATAREWSGESSAAEVFEHAARWARAGARVIGGCCRTTPEDIVALRRALVNAGLRREPA